MKSCQSAYIVSKPLQYINSTNIENDCQSKVCFLCDSFADSDNFFKIVSKETKYFNDFKFFKNEYSILFYIIKQHKYFNKIFLDADFGFIKRRVLSILYSFEFYVYEEGLGAYSYIRESNSIYDKTLLFLDKIRGNKNFIGGWQRTKGIYVYNHELFKKNIKLDDYHKLKEFKTDFCTHLLNSPEMKVFAKDIDFNLFANNKVLIYLSDWTLSPLVEKKLKDYPNYIKILKVHPNIKDDTSSFETMFDHIIPKNLVIEYFLIQLFEIAECVHVIHHGTSAIYYLDYYFQNKKNITQELIS